MKKPTPFGKYLLLDRINVGGMAEIFLGKSFGVAGFERLVAIKKILPTMVEDQEFITMFIDEARIAVQLTHANIVQIYELGKHDENYFIAMEYVSGRDLRTLLDKAKCNDDLIPQGLAVYIAQKVCEGLDYAHRKKDPKGRELGIIHRDVSPQNVLISFDGEVKLIDFGIAKAANRGQKTQAGILKGKFGYMSPEQVRGLPIDRRSDIFAVGVCLYEMLTGEKLFVSESDFSTLEKVRNAEVPPPRDFNADIPDGLEEVVMKALARNVEERYQWASDMQEDLMRFLLLDGQMFGAKHLSHFMQDGFAEAIVAENAALERYADVSAPPEMEEEADRASPGVAPKPEEHFEEPPPEMQADSDDATQVFDPSEHFGPGGDEEDEDEDASSRDRMGDDGAHDADAQSFAEPGGEGGAPYGDEEPPEDRRDELGGASSPMSADEDEDTLTPVGEELPSAPGDEPTFDEPRDAVTRLAAEIPSAPGHEPPDDSEDAPPLMEEATRITSTDEGLKTPSIRSSRPSSAHARAAGSARSSSRAPSAGHTPPRIAPTERRSSEAGGRSKLLLGAVAGSFVVVVAVLVAVFVGMSSGEPQPGELIILTNPSEGVEILIDNSLVATESPHVVTGMPPGEYTVALRRPGTRERYEERVAIPSGVPTEIELSLEPAVKDVEPVVAVSGTQQDGQPVVDGDGGADEPDEIEDGEAPAALAAAIIRSVPRGATVTAGGESLGTTPLTLEELASDEVHSFVVTMDGYKDEDIDLELGDGDNEDVTVRLERERPEPTVDEAALAEKRRRQREARARRLAEQRKKAEAAAKAKQAAAAKGTLVAMTNPVAQVIVNGRETGRWTPVPPGDPIELPAGVHEVKFQASDGRSRTMQVTIEPNEQTRLVGISF